jgi:hypothetical protein
MIGMCMAQGRMDGLGPHGTSHRTLSEQHDLLPQWALLADTGPIRVTISQTRRQLATCLRVKRAIFSHMYACHLWTATNYDGGMRSDAIDSAMKTAESHALDVFHFALP